MLSGIDQNLLHIAITQVRVGFQHQGDNARDHGRSGGGAGEVGDIAAAAIFTPARLVTVGRDHVDTIRAHQHIGARCGEARHIVVGVNRTHRNDLTGILEVVIVGIVATAGTVAGRENKHRTQAVTAIFHTSAQSLPGKG